MNPTIPLGRIGGVRVGIHWSLLIVFALIAWSLVSRVFPAVDPNLSKSTYVAMGLVAAFLYLASILLHELGHAWAARREGVAIDNITLWLFGGVARFNGAFRSPGTEFRVGIAGPLVSLVLGGLCVGLAQIDRSPVEVEGVASWLGYMNLILFLFNMLPALPLDGGRVFHAVLWRVTNDLPKATRIAAGVGRAFGYLLIAAGVALVFSSRDAWGGVWFVLIGWFLVQAATAEGRRASRMRV